MKLSKRKISVVGILSFMLAIELFDSLAQLRHGLFNEFIVRKILVIAAIVLTLTGCAGTNIGVGAGTGFPGIGLGAGISLPVGSNDETYIRDLKRTIIKKIPDAANYKGQFCTVRISADNDGLLMDVKRMDGDEKFCDAAMVAFYSFNRIPAPPASLAPRLIKGMVIDLAAN